MLPEDKTFLSRSLSVPSPEAVLPVQKPGHFRTFLWTEAARARARNELSTICWVQMPEHERNPAPTPNCF